MNYINILLAKINHFNSKMADSNYSDICSLYHSNYSSTKHHICFSPSMNNYCHAYVMCVACVLVHVCTWLLSVVVIK